MRFAYEITLNHDFSICQNWKLRIVLSEIGRKINENATCSIYKTYSCGAIEIKYSYTTNLLKITKKISLNMYMGLSIITQSCQTIKNTW